MNKFGRFRLFLVFAIVITNLGWSESFRFSNLKIPSDEQVYIDSLDQNISTWYRDEDIPYRERFDRFDQLLKKCSLIFGDSSISFAFILHKKGVLFNDMGYQNIEGSFDSSIYYTKKALEIRLLLFQEDKVDLRSDIINGYTNIGISYSLIGDHQSSLKFLLKGLEHSYNHPVKDSIYERILRLYTQTARTYVEIGDYDQAIKYYNNIINFSIGLENEEDIETLNIWRIRAFLELAGLYANQLSDPETSLDALEHCRILLMNSKKYILDYFQPFLFNKKAMAFYRMNNYDSAHFYFRRHLNTLVDDDSSVEAASSNMNIALTFINKGPLDSAEYFLDRAKSIYQGTNQNYKLASIYDNFGDLEFKRGNFFKSIECDNLSMTSMIAGFMPVSIFDNPSLDASSIYDKMGVFISLSSKSETLLHLYKVNNNEEYLMAAYTTFQLADQVIGMMRSEFQAEASRMSLASYAKPIYEHGIEACYLLYQLQPHDSLLSKAFEYAEKSKAIVLLDAVRKTNARAHVNPQLIEAEKAMNLKANYFEKQAALYEQDTTMTYSYGVYDSLLYYRRQRQNVVDQIRETTPEYYSLIFDQATTSPATIQQNLSKDQAFIEYFLGDSSLYAFTFTRDKTFFTKYDHPDSVKTWANEWVNAIPSINQDFIAPAHQLYSALIEPLKDADVLPKHLIISPDDILNLVNFEALVTALPSEERIYFPDFKDYMIFDHTISYAFSASTLEETQTTSHQSKKTYLGIAPTMNEGFYQHDHWFDKLDYNQEEVVQAASLFPRKNVIDKPSAKNDFLELAPSYGLIHCATHAMANNKDGDLSFIALGQDESDIIYAKDLYALDLDADLVVLSACQTSAGELNRGEGIISLARSFTYAGAASVVTSLWNVREKANKEIIYDFYHLLKKGMPKDEALTSAKLNYLSNINLDNHMNAHPYFWATMVVIGDTSPFQKSLHWKLIIPIVVLLLFVAGMYWRYRQKKINNQLT